MDSFFAGCFSGFSQTLTGHPFDTLKVWSQNKTKEKINFKNLYRGVSYPLLTSGLVNSFGFGVTQHLYNLNPNSNSYIIPGIGSGIVTGLLITPIDYYKVKSQTNGSFSFIKNLKKSYSTFNQKSFYSNLEFNRNIFKIGWIPTLGREIISVPVYFETYYRFREKYHPFICGSLAGLFSWSVSYPLDTIKTRIQSGLSISIKEAYLSGNLWRGYLHCANRAIVVNGVGWIIYEEIIKYVN